MKQLPKYLLFRGGKKMKSYFYNPLSEETSLSGYSPCCMGGGDLITVNPQVPHDWSGARVPRVTCITCGHVSLIDDHQTRVPLITDCMLTLRLFTHNWLQSSSRLNTTTTTTTTAAAAVDHLHLMMPPHNYTQHMKKDEDILLITKQRLIHAFPSLEL